MSFQAYIDNVETKTGKSADALKAINAQIATRAGAILSVQGAAPEELDGAYDPALLVHEQAVSTNTAAAGGNASLMSIG